MTLDVVLFTLCSISILFLMIPVLLPLPSVALVSYS
jgi:hypothetical protein